ncbi:hypothetical protein J437_LFUL015273 [Ladona fulva]|uniref:Kynurenine formamidase n=1 Tax=Ladona fulva TaxID=123851 RepID=A0A8K0P999_LADFU|nr:hypothetical protein J437_LFUL015273 [Ladona fulva]
MDLKELDLQYSPSRWSKRFEAERVIEEHMKIAEKASEEAKSSIPVEIGVQYGAKDGEKLDIFGGDYIPAGAPILAYVHGGYWQSLDRSISSYFVKPLFTSGICTVVVGYDIAPKAKMGEIIQEIRNAAEFILKMAVNLGSKSVWFAGHSAGAHLCSTLLARDWIESLQTNQRDLLKGLVLISGVYDLTPLINTYVNDPLGMTREDAEEYSPSLWNESIITQNVQVIIAVGQHDSPEFQRQSKEFYDKLVFKGNVAEYFLIPDVDHFDIVEKLNDCRFELTVKICNLLK